MSYRLSVLGLPVTADVSLLLRHLHHKTVWLYAINQLDRAYVTTNSDEEAAASGLRLALLWSVPPKEGERLMHADLANQWKGPPLHHLLCDDRHGIFIWDRHTPSSKPGADDGDSWQGVMTDRGDVGCWDLALQKADPDDNAIVMGAAHFGFRLTYVDCTRLLYAEQAWDVFEPVPRLVALPQDAAPFVDPYVEPDQFRLHGLPPRDY